MFASCGNRAKLTHHSLSQILHIELQRAPFFKVQNNLNLPFDTEMPSIISQLQYLVSFCAL